MNIEKLLDEFKQGTVSKKQLLEKLKVFSFEDIGFAKIDHHRSLRKGFPEVIYCENKTTDQVLQIIEKMDSNILCTRVNKKLSRAIKEKFPSANYNELGKTITIESNTLEKKGKIIILTAGTADIPVGEEVAVTCEIMGNNVEKVYDVGVAGIHRLLKNQEKLNTANVIIVIAGMEGALPSVVGGITDKPIIAVPTSVGYGANFQGIAPLLTMLNSCAPGIGIVNIDNGFGAGFLASLINRQSE